MYMINPYDKIEKKEFELIEEFIAHYATHETYIGNKIWLKEWNEKKQDLFKMLGNNLIYDLGTFDYSLSGSERYNLCAGQNSKNFHRLEECLYDSFYKYVLSEEDKKDVTRNRSGYWFCFSYGENSKKILQILNFIHEYTIDSFTYDDNTTIKTESLSFKLPSGRTGRIVLNERKTKALNRWIHVFDLDHNPNDEKENALIKELRELSSWYSNFLSFSLLKKNRDNIKLSIHPLDYITMSENNSSWTSCMNWSGERNRIFGEYRVGTVEMMNSPYVVVAYIENNSSPYIPFDDFEWSNKKWRELFIVSDTLISPVKGYPYTNRGLEENIIKEIKKLAKENLGWEYKDYKESSCYFCTDGMYNDTEYNGVEQIYYGIDVNIEDFPEDFEFMYSGIAVCPHCGEKFEYYGESVQLVCERCDGLIMCQNCGSITETSKMQFDDLNEEWLCDECYEKNFEIDEDEDEEV